MNTKRFLIFAGQEFYANGGANDLVSTSPRTKEKAIEYARSLLSKDKRFITNFWFDEDTEFDDGNIIEWVQVFDLELCEVIFRRGKVFGDDSGIVIL